MPDIRENDDGTPAGTGHDNDGGVDSGNDAFATAFAAFASGGNPDPIDDEDDADEGADDAGQDDGAQDGGDPPPNEGDDDKSPHSAAPGDAAAAGDEPDPWADATDAQRAALEKMRRDYETKLAGASGRASGLQRQLNELQRSQQQPAPAPAAPQQEEKSDGWKALDDKIKQLQEDYPEIAGPMIEILTAQRDELAQLRSQVAPAIEAGNQEAVRAQVAALEERHSDWRAFANGQNEDFEGWLSSQPENIQRMGRDSMDAREVGAVISLFKAERAEAMAKAKPNDKPGEGDEPKPNKTDARRERQLDGGREVRSRTVSATTGAPDDFEGAFNHFAGKMGKK